MGGSCQLQQEDPRHGSSGKGKTVVQSGHAQDAPVFSCSLYTSIVSCQLGAGLENWYVTLLC